MVHRCPDLRQKTHHCLGNRTGAPRSHQRTWDENGGRSPSTALSKPTNEAELSTTTFTTQPPNHLHGKQTPSVSCPRTDICSKRIRSIQNPTPVLSAKEPGHPPCALPETQTIPPRSSLSLQASQNCRSPAPEN